MNIHDAVYFYAYIRFFLGILGAFGTILMFIVYSKRDLRKLTISIYFRAMSISNLWANIMSILQFIEFINHVSLVKMSQFSCKTLKFSSYLNESLSAWFLVAAGIDRFINIFNINRFPFLKKANFSFTVVAAILTFNLVLYIQIFFTIYLDIYEISKLKSMVVCFESQGLIFKIMDFINSTALPFFIMLITSIATLTCVFKSRHRIYMSTRQRSLRRKQLRDIRFGITIFSLNMSFLLCNAPRQVFLFVEYKLRDLLNLNTHVLLSFLFLFFQNFFYSITFFEQVLTNKIVRKQLLQIFK